MKKIFGIVLVCLFLFQGINAYGDVELGEDRLCKLLFNPGTQKFDCVDDNDQCKQIGGKCGFVTVVREDVRGIVITDVCCCDKSDSCPKSSAIKLDTP